VEKKQKRAKCVKKKTGFRDVKMNKTANWWGTGLWTGRLNQEQKGEVRAIRVIEGQRPAETRLGVKKSYHPKKKANEAENGPLTYNFSVPLGAQRGREHKRRKNQVRETKQGCLRTR